MAAPTLLTKISDYRNAARAFAELQRRRGRMPTRGQRGMQAPF